MLKLASEICAGSQSEKFVKYPSPYIRSQRSEYGQLQRNKEIPLVKFLNNYSNTRNGRNMAG